MLIAADFFFLIILCYKIAATASYFNASQCYGSEVITNSSFLLDNDLVYAAWIEENGNYKIALYNGDRVYKSDFIRSLLHRKAYDIRPFDSTDDSLVSRLFMLEENLLVLVYPITVSGNNKVEAVKNNKVEAAKLYPDTQIYNMTLKKSDSLKIEKLHVTNSSYHESRSFIANLVVERGAIVDSEDCKYIWRLDEHAVNERQDCNICKGGDESYCVGDLGRKKSSMSLVKFDSRRPYLLSYYNVAFCNWFSQTKINDRRYFNIAFNHTDLTNTTDTSKDLCFELPPDHHVGFLWDKKWSLGDDNCQAIKITTKREPISCTWMDSTAVFVASCVLALLISFACVASVFIEHSGRQKKKHEKMMKAATRMPAAQSEYGSVAKSAISSIRSANQSAAPSVAPSIAPSVASSMMSGATNFSDYRSNVNRSRM